LIGLGVLGVYGNTPYMPGAGFGIGLALLFVFCILNFCAIVLGLALRWGMRRLFKGASSEDVWMFSWQVVPWVDLILMALFMVIPAGIIAMILGSALAGSESPLAVHLVLLVVWAAMTLGAFWVPDRRVMAAGVGLSVALAVITVDSMRLGSQLRAALPEGDYCLAIGPDHLPLDQVPRLMGLTAQKPILRVTGAGDRAEVRRWSFRYHGFVWGGREGNGLPCLAQP